MTKPEDVTYLEEVVAKVQAKIDEAGHVTLRKVLPGTRAKVLLPLREAQTLLKAVTEVLDRSGMGKRLGFVKTPDGIQLVEEDNGNS